MSINELIRNASASAASDRFSSADNDLRTPVIPEVITCAHCGVVIDGATADTMGYEFEGETVCRGCYLDETLLCDCCNVRFWRDDLEEVANGDLICPDCLENNYAFCEHCEQYVRSDEINWCEDTCSNVCDDCVNDWSTSFFHCDRCHDVHHGDTFEVYYNDHSSETWCQSCYDWHSVFFCDECERYFDEDHVDRYDDDGHCVCAYCFEGHNLIPSTPQAFEDIRDWEAPSGVRPYGYKPTPCFLLTAAEKGNGHDQSDTVCFGVELEMEDNRNYGRNLHTDADWLNNKLGFTYCKRDGSLTNGLEMVSHPASFNFWMGKKDVLEEAFKEMIHLGYNSHDNGHCGLHVHLSLMPLLEANPNAASAMLVLVDRFWDELVCFSRRTEHQLAQWARRYYTKDKPYEDLAKMNKREGVRYMAVNLQNKHTIELRIFRGTLKIETFIATLQLCERLVDTCIHAEVMDLNTMTWEQLIGDKYEELTSYCKKRFDPQPVTFEDHTVFEDAEAVPAWWPTPAAMHAENLLHALRTDRPIVLKEDVVFDDITYLAGTPVVVLFSDAANQNFACVMPTGSEYLVPAEKLRIKDEDLFVGEDWVRFIADPNTGECASFRDLLSPGMIGRVVTLNDESAGIDFGRDIGGVSIEGRITNGHGLWVSLNNLELL